MEIKLGNHVWRISCNHSLRIMFTLYNLSAKISWSRHKESARKLPITRGRDK